MAPTDGAPPPPSGFCADRTSSAWADTPVGRVSGVAVKNLTKGRYTFVVNDTSRTRNFQLSGPGVHKTTSVRGMGRSTWTVTLKKGAYTFSSVGRPTLKRAFKVR